MELSRGSAFALAVSSFAVAAWVSGCSKSSPPGPATETQATAASASTIPATPVAGTVEGEPFVLKKVSLTTAKGYGEWRMTVEGSTPTAEKAAVRLPVRTALAVGKSVDVTPTGLTPGSKPAGVSVQAGPKNTTSTDATYRVEITKWDVKPCPTDGDPQHEGGLASGKILVKVPSEKVEVAGTFTDAVVTYGATPDWTYR